MRTIKMEEGSKRSTGNYFIPEIQLGDRNSKCKLNLLIYLRGYNNG
jgi:hypothetical protein